MFGDDVHLRLRLQNRHSRFEPSDHSEVMTPAIFLAQR